MQKLPNTHIIVDGFDKSLPKDHYIYFITHMHSDHYRGLTATWDLGTIYCSKNTKIILQNLYPQITRVVSLPNDTPTEIEFQNQKMTVTLFDANHCPGSVMILIQGPMGSILHTGDMRFEPSFFENAILYPPHLKNDRNEGVSIHIDELYLDNTFCDPVFAFPDRVIKKFAFYLKN
jgi:Cft2 family RNA processing exonuclease